MTLPTGTRVGSYEILAPLGAGGMGEVYRARDTKLNRDVAIKVLPDLFTNDPDRLARFEREAKVLASLNHSNIAAIYGLEDSGDVRALVMELVEGPTLADRIAFRPLPLDEVLPIAKQVAEALGAAHERGIIHRDLKPANVKVRDDGTVKVLDFGLAKALDPTAALNVSGANSPTITTPAMMTGVGVILGTAAYMSPEQAKGRPADRRSDIWAFGCVLYEMLTGKRAFEGEDVGDTLATILKGAPDWAALPAGTPATISTMLRRCLAKDAGERIHDIADARLDVRDALAALGNEDVAVAIPRRRREWIAWVLFAAAFATAIVLAALTSVQRPPQDSLAYRASLQLPANVTLVGSGANRFSLSPDGRRLAFVASAGQGGRPMLWVRPLNGLIAQPLSGTEDADLPFWSPDSRFIGFFAAGKIKKIDAAGGPSSTVCDYPANSSPIGATWNRDDVILFSFAAGQAGVQRVPASGGTPSAATTPDRQSEEIGHVRPFFLPDGRHFLYMALGSERTGGGPIRSLGIDVASLDSHERKRLVPDGQNPSYARGHVVFLRGSMLMAQALDARRLEMKGAATPIAEQVQNTGAGGPGLNGTFAISETGALVYQVGSTQGRTELMWFDRSGKQLGALGDQGDYRDVELSPDGTRAAVSVVDAATTTPSIWIFDLARGVPSRLTFTAAWDYQPIWSPDSSRIVFASRRTGRQDLYMRASNGAGDDAALLTDDGNFKVPTGWSPDGRFILYSRRPPGGRGRPTTDRPLNTPPSGELWVLPLFGDRKPFPLQQKPFRAELGRFSPDGRWVAYTSNESGRAEVYVTPFPGPGGRWRVSTAGGTGPTWRRDGREFFYLAPDGKLMAATVNGRGSTFEIGAAQALFETTLRSTVGALKLYDASADGQQFLINTIVDDPRAASLTLVVNWQAGLKK